jgi:hypothetical protein
MNSAMCPHHPQITSPTTIDETGCCMTVGRAPFDSESLIARWKRLAAARAFRTAAFPPQSQSAPPPPSPQARMAASSSSRHLQGGGSGGGGGVAVGCGRWSTAAAAAARASLWRWRQGAALRAAAADR